MDELAFDAQSDWNGALTQTASTCSTYFHMRNPHWIALGARVWAEQLLWSPAPSRSLPEELMRLAKREVEVRSEFTTRMFRELAERFSELPSSQVLVDCTRCATELLRDGCRDVEADVVRTARFVPGVDVGAVTQTLSLAIQRLTDHLLVVRGEAGRT
jgi:hypothetical protein